MLQPVHQLPVALLGRNVAVHQHDAERQALSGLQVRLDELRPFRRLLPRQFGVSVSRQVHKVVVGARLSRPPDLKKINCARSPWRTARLRHLLAEQGVDQAGLPHIRSPQERDLRRPDRRELSHLRRRSQKLGIHPHRYSVPPALRLCPAQNCKQLSSRSHATDAKGVPPWTLLLGRSLNPTNPHLDNLPMINAFLNSLSTSTTGPPV